jgi:O-antigen/teichoic acid export membrane protein
LSLLQKATIINAGTIIGIIFGTVQTIILTRVLGPDGIGQYSLSVAVLSLATTLCAFGCPLSYLFYAKQDPEENTIYFANAFRFLSIMGIVSGIVIGAMFLLHKDYFGQYRPYAMLCIVLYMPLSLLRLLFRNHLLVAIHAKKLVSIELLSVGMTLIFICFVWSINELTVNMALFAFFLTAVLRAGFGWFNVHKEINLSRSPNHDHLRQLLVMGGRQMWPDIFTMFNDQIGILLFKMLVEDFGQTGLLSRAISLASLLILLSQALMPVLFSSWAGLSESVIRFHVEKAMRFVVTLSLLVALGMILFGDWIVFLLYGERFLTAVMPMRILVAGAAFAMVGRTFIQLFGGRGMPEKGSAALAIGSTVTALLCLALIPRWGIIGCASAITIGQFTIMMAMIIHGKINFQLSLARCTIVTRDDMNIAFKNLIGMIAFK